MAMGKAIQNSEHEDLSLGPGGRSVVGALPLCTRRTHRLIAWAPKAPQILEFFDVSVSPLRIWILG